MRPRRPRPPAARRLRPIAGAAASSVLIALGAVAAPSSPVAAQESQQARAVRTVWTSEFGVDRPAGITFAPRRGYLLVADARGTSTAVLRLGFDEDPHGSFRLPPLAGPGTLAFDAARNRLTAIDGDELVTVAGRDLDLARPPVTHGRIDGLGLQQPRGATFDPSTGTWFVLDAGTREIVVVPRRGLDAATRISLASLGPAGLFGIAFNRTDGLLYVAGSHPDALFALDATGALRKTYDLASLELMDPRAVVFAPSSDTTDDPGRLNLFVVDAGDAQTLGGATEATLAPAATLSAPTVTATLVRTIDTSRWSPASPDPSGVVYLPGRDRLEVSDSEVDETTGAGYHGVNLWQVTRTGSVTDTGTTEGYPSKEPTGLGYDASTDTLFVSDDTKRRVYVVRPGSDGRFGTGDDQVRFVDAGAYGSTDTEDPEFVRATGHLYFLDGVGTEVYDIAPGNGIFGDGDDVMRHFDVGRFGPTDWEGLSSDPSTGNLLVGARKEKQIFEVTTSGTLVRVIDVSGISGMKFLSGLGTAPASDGSGTSNYWIVDRAVDNGSKATENDGKLFEVTTGASQANRPPVVTNPGSKTNAVGDTVSYQIQASDPDGDPIASYGASGLPTGLSVDSASGRISGTTTTAGTFDVVLTATDSRGATGSASFTWTVTGSGSGSVLTFGPDADAFIRSDRPDRNFGSKPAITVDAVPQKDSLMRFTVSGIGANAILSVKLRLYCTDASPVGGVFYPVADDSWGEGTVTWNNAPPAGSTAAATLGSVSAGTTYDVDLSSYVTGDGAYSLRIVSTHKNAASYASKEGTVGPAPTLVVTLA